MAKRPSAPSTRAKQHQVIRYIYSTDLKTAARHYNVSPQKLSRFISANPKRLKSRVQKDPAYSRLYKTDIKELAATKDIRLIPRLSSKRYYDLQRTKSITERQQLAVNYKSVTRTRIYHKRGDKVTYEPVTERMEQTTATRLQLLNRGFGQYTTVNAVHDGFENGTLSSADVNMIVGLWKEKYGLKDDRTEELINLIMDGGEGEDADQ